ncbi:hypothetical protein A3F65_03090 [Candidatus Saccharibacteria bacterium RIFCSPHIGHO2_12_FULL_47_16b]|nr:MAG: hypothetical protein A3F65_03090 [Candidatus Saccharibacteria bacterium RIFCSPHIGHO2_12_FULL_47_16b]OGL37987.1 MAG: hypothetical protein A3J32_00045 [Candidatus Saccharibacteria bacterium RIFCSPLOWO2_02_FULL_46_7]
MGLLGLRTEQTRAARELFPDRFSRLQLYALAIGGTVLEKLDPTESRSIELRLVNFTLRKGYPSSDTRSRLMARRSQLLEGN